MTGTSAKQFSPDTEISRSMIVSILHRLDGTPSAKTKTFRDTASGQWYTNAISWASENDIVSGYSNGSFGPNDTITHEQLLSILYRYAQSKHYNTAANKSVTVPAALGNVHSYAEDAIKWAVSKSLVATNGNSMLPANAKITRAQAADVLMRFCEKVSK